MRSGKGCFGLFEVGEGPRVQATNRDGTSQSPGRPEGTSEVVSEDRTSPR